MRPFQIAIDGPVAAGKSTVARELSRKLGFVYVDTGAMYRAVTLAVLRRGMEIEDEGRIAKLVMKLEIDVRMPNEQEQDGRLSTVLLEGEDVSWEIRGERVSGVVARVAAMPRVREVLVEKQRRIATSRDVVMEGRDITYVVLPEADLKIFLTASEKVRVERYYLKLKKSEPGLTRERARELLQERDELDRTRKTSPLRVVEGAWVLDTSEMEVEEVVEMISARIKEMRK